MNLRFNPMIEDEMLKAYPQLGEILTKTAGEDEHIDKLLRFIIMLNDPKSIVFLSEKDLDRRKNLAAELSGLPDNAEYLEGIFMYKNQVAFQLTIQFLCRFIKNKEFAALVTMEQVFWEEIRLLNKPISEAGEADKDVLIAVEKKGKIKAELELDLNRIDAYYKKFLGDDPELINKRERMTPENIRKLKSQGN